MRILANLNVYGTLDIDTVANAGVDTDRFLVQDSNGVVKYRTGAEMLSDIGAASASGYIPYTGATQNVDLGEYGVSTGFTTFDTTPTGTPTTQGTMYWDDSHSTVALIMNGTIQHIGQDSYFYVKNSTGSPIPKGTAVRFDGTDGASGHLLIAPFLADGTFPSFYFMGVTSEAIANGGFGQVTHFGEIEGIDTSIYTAGDLLYASTTSAGGFQTTVPSAPNNIILVAAAVNSKNNGAIVVRPSIGSNINNDEGVLITSPANNQGLFYDSTSTLWVNKSIPTALGYTPANAATTLTINGTTYDLSANRTWNVGTVTGTGTTNYLPKFTSVSAIGNSQVFDNGTNIGIGTATPIGKLNINTGTTGNNVDVVTQASGTISFANGSSGTAVPNIVSKSSNNLGLNIISVVPDVPSAGIDMQFDVRETDNTDFSTLTSTAFNFSRFGNSLLRILRNGNVGIGTASPDSLLHIFGNTASTNIPRIKIEANGWSNDCRIERSSGADGFYITNNYDTSTSTADNAAAGTSGIQIARGDLRFHTGLSGAFTEGMRISGGGNVLIGTTTDNTIDKLQVSGSGLFTGNVVLGDGTNITPSNLGAGQLQVVGSGYRGYVALNGTGMYIGHNSAARTLNFDVDETTRLTINASGNVGIGTATPNIGSLTGTVLTINGSVQSNLEMASAGVSRARIASSSSDTTFETRTALPIVFGTNATERMRLDASGNLGLGVTPSAWLGGFKAIDINTGGAIASSGTTNIRLFQNAYYDGTNYIYKNSVAASRYDMSTSGHQWFTAPSGTAGTAISFTQAMTLDANGDLLLKGTYNPYTAANRGNITLNGTSSNIIVFTNNTSSNGYILHQSNQLIIFNEKNDAMTFGTNNTERMRVSGGGNVLIDTTTDAGYKLDVNGTARVVTQILTPTIYTTNIYNSTSGFNAQINTSTSGTRILRNVADANAAFGVTQTNASSTGDIQFWANSGGTVATMTQGGELLIGTTSASGGRLTVQQSSSGAATTPLYVLNTPSGVVGSEARIFLGNATSRGVYIASVNTSSGNAHDLVLATSASASLPTERMRITSGGNVLIGTTTDIASSRRELVMRGGNGSVISLGNNTTADRFQIVSDSGENALLNNKANTPMILYTNNTERMRITSGGNVLIGTTTDAGYKLDVNGTGRFSGDLRSNNGQLYLGIARIGGDSSANIDLNYNTGNTAGFNYYGGTTSRKFYVDNTGAATFSSSVTAASLIKSGGTSSQYLMADGSTSTLTNPVTGTGTTNYIPKFTGSTTLGDSGIFDNGTNVGIGTTSVTAYALRLSRNITGGTTANGMQIDGQIQSNVTATARHYNTNANTADGFSLGSLSHYRAAQGSFGTTTVGTQYGFYAHSTLTGATNNYGFAGEIAAGTGRWNLYMSGTANNYIAGSLGIGTPSLTGYNLRVSKNITGSTVAIGVYQQGTVQSDVTSTAFGFRNDSNIQDAAFTLVTYSNFEARQGTFGASSTVTNQYGFSVHSSLTGATNNYGFYGNIAAATGRWNLYMNGTAINYLNGALLIGNNADNGTDKLQVSGSVNVTSSMTASSLIKSGGTASQILAADGSVITAGTNITISGGTISAAFSGGVTGSGTTNYIPKWTSSSALGNSIIQDSGTKVSISSTASEVFGVSSTSANGAYISIDNTSSALIGSAKAIYSTSLSDSALMLLSPSNLYLQTTTNQPILINAFGGRVLINTDTDDGTNTLQVNGSVKAANLLLGAGTTSIAPLDFTPTSAALKTTAAAGDMEVDSNGLLYYTHNGSSRGYVPSEQYLISTSTRALTNTTTSQNLFSTASAGASSFTPKANTTYFFEAYISIVGLSSSTNAVGFGLSSTGTVSGIDYVANSFRSTALNTPTASNMVRIIANTISQVTIASTATSAAIFIRGTIRIGATAGVITPIISMITNAAVSTINTNTYVKFIPIGINTIQEVPGSAWA